MSRTLPKLNFDDPAAKLMALQQVSAAVGWCHFECRKARGQRSLSQNAYFHSVILPHAVILLQRLWGEPVNEDQAKRQLKEMFLRVPVVNKATGEVRTWETLDTHELDKPDFYDLVERVRAWALSHGHFIPEPDPNWKMNQTEAA